MNSWHPLNVSVHIAVKYDPQAGTAQSVWRVATGRAVRGSNPGADDVLRIRPASNTKGIESLSSGEG
jgi:hypothetical protein